MLFLLFSIILIFLLIIESTIVSYPFIFVLLFFLFMRYQTITTLVMVLLTGSLLDNLRLVPVGLTPLILFGLFFILFLYTRKIDVRQILIIFITCFFATIFYSYVANYPINLLFHLIVFSALFMVAFITHRKKKSSYSFSPFVD